MTNILKEIVSNHGYVTKNQLPELAQKHPSLPLVIKWSCAPRGIYEARDVEAKIKMVESRDKNEYAREVFISANQLDTIRKTLVQD